MAEPNPVTSSETLLIDLYAIPLAGIWYQWLTVVCALAYSEAHREDFDTLFLSHPELDKNLLRLADITLPQDADAERCRRRHCWKVASGTRSYNAFQASIPIRQSIYRKMRIGEESRVAQAVVDRIGRPYSCVITRGIPAIRSTGVPLLCLDSTYYTRMVGETDPEMLLRALNPSAWPAEARSNPVVVCGDAYEDTYAEYLRAHGFEVFTKNRDALIRSGMDVNGLALVDFVLAVGSRHLFGLCTSALYFSAREARLYLHGNTNSWEYIIGHPMAFQMDRSVITPLEWAAQVLVCDVVEGKYPLECFHANFQSGSTLVRDLHAIAARWATEPEQI